MTVYYPSYYKDFHCIAEKCRHSCCVGWEISVDSETLKNYERLERGDILCHIKEGEITLLENGRCPFLDGGGLCRIISSLGEGCVSEICREHPRFYNKVCGRVECGIGASCEEACRIILSSDGYRETYSAVTEEKNPAEQTDLDTLTHREYIYSVLSDRAASYIEKIALIKEKYHLTEPVHTCEEWSDIFESLEYLEESHRGLFSVGGASSSAEAERLSERFLAYLVFRHVSVAENYQNLRARLGFCLLLCSVLDNFLREVRSFEESVELVRIISEEIEYSEENTAALIFEFEENFI